MPPLDHRHGQVEPAAGEAGSPLTGRGERVEEIRVPRGPDAEPTDWSKADTLDRQAYTATVTPSWDAGGAPAPVRSRRSNGWPGATQGVWATR